jgi:alkanesulfonate monooxygenase SsuD/methylene tetrahydromethanopterin reductase-like flavin-dependent oxidoreductase (luciferase family)
VQLSIRYDMRAPGFGAPPAHLYRAVRDQAAWADRVGCTAVYLGEHHGADDDYLPSSIVLGAALAAVTDRLRIHLSALVAVLHDPLRLAEDLAVLDLVSNGRVDATLGMGYRPHEFAMFGLDAATRVERLEAAFRILPLAWTGEPFEYQGTTVTVRPRPVQRPGPPLYFGATTSAAARRAARMGVPINPTNPAIFDVYEAELEALGKPPPSGARPPIKHDMQFLYVTDDPERDWPIIAPHVLHTNNSYARWAQERAGQTTGFTLLEGIDDLKTHARTHVLTPEECVGFLTSLGPDAEMVIQPMMSGLDPDVAMASLVRLEHDVLPALARAGLWHA